MRFRGKGDIKMIIWRKWWLIFLFCVLISCENKGAIISDLTSDIEALESRNQELKTNIDLEKTDIELAKTELTTLKLREAGVIIELWETFREFYNNGKRLRAAEFLEFWTGKDSDQLYINIAENEMIEASGSKGVTRTLELLNTGHHSTKNDKFVGSPMNEVYIKMRGAQLVASATGPNAFRKAGQTWAYFVKVDNKWKINKIESIEQRNMAIHTEILIHEKNMTDKIGYFDDPEYRIK